MERYRLSSIIKETIKENDRQMFTVRNVTCKPNCHANSRLTFLYSKEHKNNIIVYSFLSHSPVISGRNVQMVFSVIFLLPFFCNWDYFSFSVWMLTEICSVSWGRPCQSWRYAHILDEIQYWYVFETHRLLLFICKYLLWKDL